MTNGELPASVRRAAVRNHLALLVWIPAIAVLTAVIIFNGPAISGFPLAGLCIALLSPILFQGISILVWLINAPLHPFVDEHGKEAVNVWLSELVYLAIAALMLSGLLFSICGIPTNRPNNPYWSWSSFGLLLMLGIAAIGILMLLLQLLAVSAAILCARRGQIYHYPRTLRFIR